MPEMRTVKVVDRSTWGTPGRYPRILRVAVPWVCPECGSPRGEPWEFRFFDNGDYHVCNRWTNECGHVDMYADVIKEAQATPAER